MGPVTRSQSKLKERVVNFNFDESSTAWRENKNVLKNGCFEYKRKECWTTTKYTYEPNYNLRRRNNHCEAAF
jgi:hypothetical protein